nr:hypothetical protein [Tanacetum cinerariifolium]
MSKYSRKCEDSYRRILSSKSSFPQLQLGIILSISDSFELTALCTSLQRQHSELLAKFQAQEGRSINEREATAERISDDSEELARVLTSIDAETVLAGGIDVPTGSGSIPTAGPLAADISTSSEVAPTASPIVTSYSRRKGKEVMVESDTLKKQRLQEQIDAQVARELEEQQEKE